jgi:MFS family permease
VLLITAARVGDQIGRRRAFSPRTRLFTLSWAACGVAPSPVVLVVPRLMQGRPPRLLESVGASAGK